MTEVADKLTTVEEMANMLAFQIREDDVFLTIDGYCEKYDRSRASYYRDKQAGLIHVVRIGGSPRILDRSVRERAVVA